MAESLSQKSKTPLLSPAAASLLLTGGLLFIVGAAGMMLERARRSGARPSLAPPLSSDPRPLSSFQEEEQR